MKKYPKATLIKLICDMELTGEDIDSMSRGEIFDAILNYEGFVNCANAIKNIILNVYGIDLNSWQKYLDPESVAEMEGLEEA